jgi:rubrerythrin
MSDHIKLELVDADGAIREAAEDAGLDRADFFKRAAVAGGGFVAGGVLFNGLLSPAQAAISTKKASKRNDVKILNYALTLEYLEAEFYRQAVANNAFSSDQYKQFATVVAEHEANHVSGLKNVLGKAAVKKPSFDFGAAVTDPATFAKTAQVLEDTGVAAYAGQGPNIFQRAVVVSALAIHSVEARHAAWIRYLNGATPAPLDFDKAKTEKAVLSAVKGTGFIKG